MYTSFIALSVDTWGSSYKLFNYNLEPNDILWKESKQEVCLSGVELDGEEGCIPS